MTTLRVDHAGKPIRVPPRSLLSYDQFADCVDALTPECCSWPDGQRIDPRTKRPCCRQRQSEHGCEHHTAKRMAKESHYGRFLPKAVRQKFALARTSPELLNISDDVGLIQARLFELESRLDTGESGKAWMDLQELWSDFVTCQQRAKQCDASGDELGASKWKAKGTECMQSIGKVIKSGAENETIWKEITDCSTLLANLKTAETRRKRESGQVLGIEQALLFVDKLQQIILDHVRDKTTRDRIATDMAVTLGIAGIRSSRSIEPDPQAIEAKPATTATRKFSVDEMLGE